jgi:D-serine deaminase-like pyridoxal phosphate-dependent protein
MIEQGNALSRIPNASVPRKLGPETRADRLKRYRHALSGTPCPLAWVDLDLLESNIDAMLARARGKKLRIGTKSIRSKAILDMVLARLPSYAGLMTMSARETLWLAKLGYRDLVIGYPMVNSKELSDLAGAVAAGADITLMADLPEHLDRYEAIARAHGVQLKVCLDLDASTRVPGIYFGVHRSSLTSAKTLEALLKTGTWPHLRVEGLMAYEAQIAGVQDRPPARWMTPIIAWLKSRSIGQIHARRAEAVRILKASGAPLRFVNGGGTGSLGSTSKDESVTEITVGSGFFSPALFDHYSDFKFDPAAGFALEVTRHSHPGTWTCLGGGYPASGVGPDRAPVPYLPESVTLLEHEGAGEVQTPIACREDLAIGDLVFFRHAKAGELCERFNELHLIRGDRVVEVVKTYRGEGQCFV